MFLFFHDSTCAMCTFPSSTNNFAHVQTLSRMSSLSGRMNIAWVNIECFTGCKRIKQRRISFVLGYLRMILWKISTAISIKHRILAPFNIKKNQFWQPVCLQVQVLYLLKCCDPPPLFFLVLSTYTKNYMNLVKYTYNKQKWLLLI